MIINFGLDVSSETRRRSKAVIYFFLSYPLFCDLVSSFPCPRLDSVKARSGPSCTMGLNPMKLSHALIHSLELERPKRANLQAFHATLAFLIP